MGIAIFSIDRLLAPLSRWNRLRHPPSEHTHHNAYRSPFEGVSPPLCMAGTSAPKHAIAIGARAPGRPLRVTRVLDQGQHRSQAGRMVISGRMSEVCAELDRLSRIEASCPP